MKKESGSFDVTLEKGKTCKWEFDISKDKEVFLMVEELTLAPGDSAKFSKSSSSKVLQLGGVKREYYRIINIL